MVGLLGADVEGYFLEGCEMSYEAGKKYERDGVIVDVKFIDYEGTGWGLDQDGIARFTDIRDIDYWTEYTEPKPPQYVPYTWEDREQLRGRWYREKATQTEVMIKRLSINLKGELLVNGFNASWLLANCEWLDGTPCGKVVE